MTPHAPRCLVAGHKTALAAPLAAALTLLAPTSAGAQPLLPREGGQKESGAVFTAGLGTDLSFLTVGTSDNNGLVGSLSGGFGFGFKSGRVIGTLGLDLWNATSVPRSDSLSSSSRSTTFLFVPALQVALARTYDRRVELPLLLQLGLGGTVSSGANTTPLALTYRIGLGARYWAHPHFAVQFYGGFSGLWSIEVTGNNSGRGLGLNGAFGSLSALAVF